MKPRSQYSGKMVASAPKTKRSKKKSTLVFNIDCSLPVEDGIMKVDDLKTFLMGKIKVEGKLNNLEQVSLDINKNKVTITSDRAFSKRYLKYLTCLPEFPMEKWHVMRGVVRRKISRLLQYWRVTDPAA